MLFMGKSTIFMTIFNSKLLVYQRVNLHFPMGFLWFSILFVCLPGRVHISPGSPHGWPLWITRRPRALSLPWPRLRNQEHPDGTTGRPWQGKPFSVAMLKILEGIYIYGISYPQHILLLLLLSLNNYYYYYHHYSWVVLLLLLYRYMCIYIYTCYMYI